MLSQTPWLQRTFTFDFPLGAFPTILERFRGTPPRIEAIVNDLPAEILTVRINNAWSIQEHVGHLLDLSELDEKRFHEYLSGAAVLSSADMDNRKTHEAHHNVNSMQSLLDRFRLDRLRIVGKMENLTEDQIGRTAMHPRLKKPMRLVDWLYFVAEHDDHHVAKITGIARALGRGK